MNRFILAAAFAIVGSLAFTSKADAQYVYGYRTYVPGAGVIQNRSVATPFGFQQSSGFYSPYTGQSSYQSSYSNVWGNAGFRSGGFNPYTGFGYKSGYNFSPFYGPSFYRYGTFGYRW